nr:zinc knuckle CX2CX4HX4C [Tanacetum cinerariifolium]
MSNDGNEEIGGNSRVCESESESQANNMLKDDCGTSMEMNEINQSMNKQKEEDESQSTKANTVSPVSLQVNVRSVVKTCIENYDNHSIDDKVSKAEVIMDNKLNHIPTVIDDGHEYVIFDKELVNEGSRKRDLSACGYFVGYRMSIQELRYHLYRMWGKFRLKHILNNGNEVFVFKFDNLQRLSVIDSEPWIVNNKPMVVQKWDSNVNLDRTEHKTLPLWVKLMNLPLKAWINMGLSALASRIGSPLIMDAMTTSMCNQGIGILGYAKVLVEVNADKGLVDHIDVMYRNNVTENLEKNDKHDSYKTPTKKILNVNASVIKDVRSIANKFAMLQEINRDCLSMKLSKQDKEEVGKYENQYGDDKDIGRDSTDDEADIELDESDVYVDNSGTTKFMTENEVSGLGSDFLSNA